MKKNNNKGLSTTEAAAVTGIMLIVALAGIGTGKIAYDKAGQCAEYCNNFEQDKIDKLNKSLNFDN
jgi:hypothetical protein